MFMTEHFVAMAKTGMVSILRKDQKLFCVLWRPRPTIPAEKSIACSNLATVPDLRLDSHFRQNYPSASKENDTNAYNVKYGAE